MTLTLLKVIINIVKGGAALAITVVPIWMSNLDDEDVVFIKRLILASGSLKEIAKQYGVTYPTVRLRLDRLIKKINIHDQEETDSYIGYIKSLAINERIDFDTAKILINEYKKQKTKITIKEVTKHE